MLDWNLIYLMNLFFPIGSHVIALPSWHNPRLLLPTLRFANLWEATSFYPASRSLARLYRLLLRTRASVGLSKTRVVQSDDWPLGRFAQDVFPEPTYVTLLLGRTSPVQKVTAQLRDKNGEVLAYLKYAEKEAACRRLYQEHYMLSALSKGIGPEVLKFGTLGHGKALLTAPIPGKLLPVTLPPNKGTKDFLTSLAITPPTFIEAHPWVRSIRKQRSSNEIELDTWIEALANRHWPVVIHHGDFAPWNLLQSPKGTIRAFDWERGTLEGFPYLDVVYYILQVSNLLHRKAPAEAVQLAVSYLRNEPSCAFSSTEAQALVNLAAYNTYQLFLEDGLAPDHEFQRLWRAMWESEG
jgi:hypothetical protein